MTDTTPEAVERLARKLRTGWPIGPGDRIACDIMGEVTDLIEKSQARIAELEAEVVRLSQPAPVEPVAWPRAAQTPPEDVGALVADAMAEATKAMRKFPQPNYVISKVAEEAGEVVKAAIHCAEGRERPEAVRGEIVQCMAMLIRLFLEGDQVHGLAALAKQGGAE